MFSFWCYVFLSVLFSAGFPCASNMCSSSVWYRFLRYFEVDMHLINLCVSSTLSRFLSLSTSSTTRIMHIMLESSVASSCTISRLNLSSLLSRYLYRPTHSPSVTITAESIAISVASKLYPENLAVS